MRVGIISTTTSNEASVAFALQRLGVSPKILTKPSQMSGIDRFILPGVGSASRAMEALKATEMDRAIRDLDRPLLGICLGMQILFEYSMEDECACLGILEGRVEPLPAAPDFRIPHMGWNRLQFSAGASVLLNGIRPGEHMYFVHSYYHPASSSTLATCEYSQTISAVVGKGHIFGCQFHPERSAKTGKKFLQNFLEVSC